MWSGSSLPRFDMKRSAHKSLGGYLWTGVAVVACPCHLPLLVGALAGTAAGAALASHWLLALGGLAGLFVLAAARAWMALSQRECDCVGERAACVAPPSP